MITSRISPRRRFTKTAFSQRWAFTLVELLVALAVITLLAGIALPATKSMLKEQRVSRSASLLQSAIQEARARAVAEGGGGGLIIDRRGPNSLAGRCESTQIRYLTTPPTYRGEPGSTTAILGRPRLASANPLTGLMSPSGRPLLTLWFPPGASLIERSSLDMAQFASSGTPARTLVNIGDTISIGDVGFPMTVYAMNTIVATTSTTDDARFYVASATPSANPDIGLRNADLLSAAEIPDADVPFWNRIVMEAPEGNIDLDRYIGTELTFAIRRSPQPAIAQPITLPNGTSIDLTASGVGSGGNQFSPFAIANNPGTPYAFGNYRDTSVEPFTNQTTPNGPMDYGPIYILFDSRGAVSRVLSTLQYFDDQYVFGDVRVTGDIYLLVSEAGQIKTDPDEQLEDTDSSPLTDAESDGTTPLLNSESIWVTIRARTGDVISSPWLNPNSADDTLVPPLPAPTPTGFLAENLAHLNRLQAALVLTRSGASQMQESVGR